MAREPCVGLVSVFADEVALVVKELGLEEGLPLAKALCSQHEKTNKQGEEYSANFCKLVLPIFRSDFERW